MADFVEFQIFDGVSGDLRLWIAWLEDFFVRERFTADEKMNLAQSLLEGEAEAWFYSSQKRFLFQSWEHLMDLLIWRFGDFSDPELFLLWDKNDRLLQKQRVDAKIRRMKPTLIPEKDSIQVHVSSLEPSLQIPKDSSNVCENSQAVVGCEHQRSIQKNIGMDVVNGDVERIQRVMSIKKNVSAYQSFDKMSAHKERMKPKTKRKLSLSLKTWMFKGLEAMKKMKVLKSWMFKYKPERRRSKKRHNQDELYTWSRRGRRKNKGAKLQNFSTHKLHNQLFAMVADNIHTLPQKPATSSSMLPLYVNQMGVSDIQDNDKEMVAAPVSPQLILDDLKSHMRHKWKSKHLQAVVGLQNNLSYALDVVTQPVTECKTTAAIFQLVLEQSVSHDCFLGSLWEKKNVSWLGIVCGLAECMMLKATVISARLPETIRGREWVTDSGRLQTVLEQIIHGDDEACTKSLALHSGLGENVHILPAAELNELQFIPNAEQMFHRLFLRQHKSSSIWHRWRRKGELKGEQKPCETEDGVHSTSEVNREFLIQWQNQDASQNSWMLSKDFVLLYPAFQLEDKLRFVGGSIDTNHHSFYRKRSKCQLSSMTWQ